MWQFTFVYTYANHRLIVLSAVGLSFVMKIGRLITPDLGNVHIKFG